MKTILLFPILILSLSSVGQTPLHFVELGSDPAYCRTENYQSGNGVVFASAGGGVPDYTYQWVELNSGNNNPVTTWGGLNPGFYQITVTDDIGDVLIDTVEVDSINPIAIIEPGGNDVFFNGQFHMAAAPATIELNNVSLNTGYDLASPWYNEFNYAWKLGNFEPWINDTSDWNISHRQVTFEYAGVHGVCLAVENKNACKDTACFYFVIDGPLETDEEELNFQVNLSQNYVLVQSSTMMELEMDIYDITGKLVFNSYLFSGEQVNLGLKTGTYIYVLKERQSERFIESGKFQY